MSTLPYTQSEWDALITAFPPGKIVSGTVVECHQFGVFVQLDDLPHVTALLEHIHFKINELSPAHKIQFPIDYPAIGERIHAKILAWCLRVKDVRITQLSHLQGYGSITTVD